MTTVDELQTRWRLLWQVIETENNGDEIYRSLADRYSEHHRAYHTLEHIRQCLLHFDAARYLVERQFEVELAVWFHDVIYDPHRTDNEEQSANFAERVLRQTSLGENELQYIFRLIRLTNHRQDRLDGDEGVLCDVDLAILGAGPERFAQYETAIRSEYEWVPEHIYRRERAKLLVRFLERPTIYHTTFFRERFEAPALANLVQAIEKFHSESQTG